MGWGDIDHFRIYSLAFINAHFTAVFKIAVIRQVDRVRHGPGDAVQTFRVLSDDRLGSHQTDGVWMSGVVEDLRSQAFFHPSVKVCPLQA